MCSSVILPLLISLIVVSVVTCFAPSLQIKQRPRIQSTRVSMNLLNRFVKVISSNVNNVIKGMEDPEKILEQAVDDMQNDLVKIRQSYAEVSATQKRMENQKKQADSTADDWYKRAQLALQSGEEELAREALARRQQSMENAESIEKQMAIQSGALEKLYSSMTVLEKKITDARRERDGLVARAKTAKAAVQVNEMLASTGLGSGSNSMEAFERMKVKVETLETQVDIAGELAATSSGSSTTMEERFRKLEGNTKVDDELEKLRRTLPGSKTQATMQLPSQSSAASDLEFQRMKKELGM